jgi:hypothetical protein
MAFQDSVVLRGITERVGSDIMGLLKTVWANLYIFLILPNFPAGQWRRRLLTGLILCFCSSSVL